MIKDILHVLSRGSRLAIVAMTGLAASSASATIVPVATQGVIVQHISGICTMFIADDGNTYMLSTLGGFTPGDRVHVSGTYNTNQAGVCFNIAAPTISVSQIRPAFAGVGTIQIIGPVVRLHCADRRNYVLPNAGGYAAGTSVYVEGIVTAARSGLFISNNVIGPAFSQFGRITDLNPGSFTFVSESGSVYSLDRPGSLGGMTFEGDYIFVEGIVGATNGGVTALTSVTSRPAFGSSGHIVASGAGTAFQPDTLIPEDTYSAAALTGIPVGTKVYLRGRSADDYDYGETKLVRDVRLSLAAESYTAVGVLNADGTVTDGSDGTTINLEYTGNWLTPVGSLVYVAGTIGSQTLTSVTYEHNEVRIGIANEGTLFNGFGCTPIIGFDTGGWIFPKNNGGLPVGTHVIVIGGYTFDVPCNDEGGLIDNSIVDNGGGCWNCQ